MKILEIPSEVYVFSIENYASKKNKLLDLINKSDSVKSKTKTSTIEETDYFNQKTNIYKSYYISLILNHLDDFNKRYYSEENPIFGLKIENTWYQKYIKNDTHSWHHHLGGNASFSSVLYVNLPNDAPSTYFKCNGKVIETNFKEGDFIMFPSSMLHSSPVSKSEKSKVIISSNYSLA